MNSKLVQSKQVQSKLVHLGFSRSKLVPWPAQSDEDDSFEKKSSENKPISFSHVNDWRRRRRKIKVEIWGFYLSKELRGLHFNHKFWNLKKHLPTVWNTVGIHVHGNKILYLVAPLGPLHDTLCAAVPPVDNHCLREGGIQDH